MLSPVTNGLKKLVFRHASNLLWNVYVGFVAFPVVGQENISEKGPVLLSRQNSLQLVPGLSTFAPSFSPLQDWLDQISFRARRSVIQNWWQW